MVFINVKTRPLEGTHFSARVCLASMLLKGYTLNTYGTKHPDTITIMNGVNCRNDTCSLHHSRGDHKAKGQDLVEFSIIVLFLILILAGIFDLGRLYHSTVVMTNASREGARYAVSFGFQQVPDAYPSITLDIADIKERVIIEAQSYGLTAADVNVTCPAGACERGQPVRVSASYTFDSMITSFFSDWSFDVTRSTEMMVPW